MKSNKTCILILGMHRSGTSVAGQLVDALGYNGGRNLKPAAHDNQKGFYEHEDVVRINDILLNLTGLRWDNYDRSVATNWSSIGGFEVRKQAMRILKQLLKEGKKVYIKDPRLCLTFPFWEELLLKLGVTIKIIVSLRNPDAVARSLNRRNVFSVRKSYWLTTIYWLNLFRNIHSYEPLILDYDRIDQWDVSQLAAFLQVHKDSVSNKIKNVYDHRLRHHDIDEYVDDVHPVHKIYKDFKEFIHGKEIKLDFIDQKNIHEVLNQSVRYVNVKVESIGEVIQLPLQLWDDEDAQVKVSVNLSEYKAIDRVKTTLHTGEIGIIRIIESSVTDNQGHSIVNDEKIGGEIIGEGLYKLRGHDIDILTDIRKSVPLADTLRLHVQFYPIYTTLYRRYQESIKEQSIIKDSFLTIMSYPFSFIKAINYDNIRLIQRALKNESWTQIARNAIKFLKSSNSQTGLTDNGKKEYAQLTSELNQEAKPLDVLWILSEWPRQDHSSGERRTLHLLDMLNEVSNIHLFSYAKVDQLTMEGLAQKGFQLYQSERTLMRQPKGRFQKIIISYYHNYYHVKSILKKFSHAEVIIDSVDINWPKEEQAVSLGVTGYNPKQIEKNKEFEINAYQSADKVWVVTETDKQKLTNQGIKTKIDIVSNVHETDKAPFQKSDSKKLLFLGGYNYYANRVTVKWIAKSIFPLIRLQVPDSELIIAGSNIDEDIEALGQISGVKVTGFIPEEELLSLYQECTLALVPLSIGSGIKGKICEAISFGLPVITNSIGNEGIGLIHKESGIISDDIDMLVQETVTALNGAYDLEQIGKKARNRLKEIVEPTVVKKSLLLSLFPKISLCVITWNGLDLLKKCIESIKEHTRYPNYEIIIHSNGCTDGTQEYLRDIAKEDKRIKPILSQENQVFVLPNNNMMRISNPNDVVLLNNDIVVTSNWLIELYKAAYTRPEIGVAGAKLIYPNGILQEYGSSVSIDGSGINHGKGDDQPFREEYSKIKATGYVSGCSFYIKRKTIERIGVFDEDFHPCYYEDSDYCYRTWKNGLSVVVAGNSVIYHFEGATAGKSVDHGFKKVQNDNRLVFVSKHRDSIKSINMDIKMYNKTLNV